MSVSARLKALERRVGDRGDFCPSCGPVPCSGGLLLRRIGRDLPPPPPIEHCPDCNGLLDEQGRSLGRNASVLTLVHIRRTLPPEEEPPASTR